MKLATRTGLASLGASALAIVVLSNVVATQFERVLRERVDERLTERAELSAPILVAVGDRISVSELNGVIESARVVTGVGTDEMRTVVVGPQPDGDLPAVAAAGLRTVEVGDESWRLLTVEVDDVPAVGDEAVVEFAEPLGAVQDRVREIRRRTFFAGLLAALGAGFVGWLFGRRAARPLTRLQHDAAAIGSSAPPALAVAERYGTPEVDDVAAALNASLADLGDAIERREEALAAARNFAASATHELRTPLQSRDDEPRRCDGRRRLRPRVRAGSGVGSIGRARSELSRMATSLATVQALSQADLAQPEWFEPMDVAALGDVADEVTSRTSASTDSTIDLEVDPTPVRPRSLTRSGPTVSGWRSTTCCAMHSPMAVGPTARPVASRSASQASTPPTLIVDDDGPGIRPDDAVRLLAPFERGPTATPGSGLGLAVADRVARAHGGRVEILPSPMGGTRVRITLGPD